MKTIYLHIGLGKTGTTLIQLHMSNYHSEYLKNGLRYIQCAGGMEGVGHQNFAKSFIREIPEYMDIPKSVMVSRIEVANELVSCSEKIILLSSENFPLAPPLEIKEFFVGLNKDYKIKIILFVRTQDELAESEYNQIIKVRQEKRSFSSYIQSEFDGNFMNLASKWEDAFGKDNLICCVYKASKSSVIEDFFDCFPIDIEAFNPKDKIVRTFQNESLGIFALSIKRMVNILTTDKIRNKHIELSKSVLDLVELNDYPALMMDSKQAKNFRKRYKKSNIQFSKRYLGKKMADLGGHRYKDNERDDIIKVVDQFTDIRN